MDLKFRIQTAARNNPWLLSTAWKYRRRLGVMGKHPARKVVERGDDALIDGYPRSANTFAWEAFINSQPGPVQVGNHVHSPAQFALARKYEVPAMLVLREPLAAALSWVVFNEEIFTPEKTLRFYVSFHRPLLQIAESFVVAPFEEVTGDFGKSIARLNARFGTAFATFDHSEESAQAIFRAMEERLQQRERAQGADLKLRRNYPHEAKEKRRQEIAGAFEDPALAGLRADARALYAELVETTLGNRKQETLG